MPRRSFSRTRSGGGVHNKEWEAACLDSTSFDLAIGTVVAFELFVADEAETLLRTRGELLLELNTVAPNERATVAVGIAMVSGRAVAAGAASLPRPGTEGSYPWLWHGWMNVTGLSEAAVINDFVVERRTIDSKAMRKMKEDESMALVLEVCESTDQTGTLLISGGFRVLSGD